LVQASSDGGGLSGGALSDTDSEDQVSDSEDDSPVQFTREEFEVLSTLTSAHMSRETSDRMLEWASHPKYRGHRVRGLRARSLAESLVKEYAPEGVMSADFTEELDGDQKIIFYYRDLYTCVVSLLQNPRFKDCQYTGFRSVQDKDGYRVYGAFNTGEWYRLADLRAGTTPTGEKIRPVPVILSSDLTVAKKTFLCIQYIVSTSIRV
jgi:hypothetical protein